MIFAKKTNGTKQSKFADLSRSNCFGLVYPQFLWIKEILQLRKSLWQLLNNPKRLNTSPLQLNCRVKLWKMHRCLCLTTSIKKLNNCLWLINSITGLLNSILSFTNGKELWKLLSKPNLILILCWPIDKGIYSKSTKKKPKSHLLN